MFDNKNVVASYFQESVEEMKKVSWPTKNQTIRLTIIVIVFCLATALIIGVFDLGFNRGYKTLVDYAQTKSPTVPTNTGTPDVGVSNIQVGGEGGDINVEQVPVDSNN